MRSPIPFFLACATVLVGGCMSERQAPMPLPVADPSLSAGGTCNLKPAQFLLGKTVDERLAEEARVRSGARIVRVLRPGVGSDGETRDSRLTLDTDRQGRITTARCA